MTAATSPDTAWSASSRFIVELVAWIAGPWAVARVTGSWWWALPTVVMLVALPAMFNTPGDKNITGIAISGRRRIALEVLLLFVALVGAALVWPWIAVAGVVVCGIVMLTTGQPRYRWLAATGG